MKNSTKIRALGYIQGLLSRLGRANCVQIALRTESSHDRFSKLLRTTDIDWVAIIWKVMQRIFGSIKGGHLIVDETTINKSWSKITEGLNWIWSSCENRHVYGYHLTLLLWTNGKVRIPLALRLYQKADKKKDQITSVDHMVDLLRYAKKALKIKPDYVLADGFYGADKVLKLLHEYGWKYVMRCKKNRKLGRTQIKKIHRHPYWEETGILTCGLKARIIRHGKRYFITNDFESTKKTVYKLYGDRWVIEEVFRVLHGELGIDECESRSLHSQMNHFYLTMIGYGWLESEKTRTESKTHYSIMLEYRFDPSLVNNSTFARLFAGA